MFQWHMFALGYHVHCDQNKSTQRLFITLDSRYRVTVAEWPLWCFPLPTDTDTEFGPHGLALTQLYIAYPMILHPIIYAYDFVVIHFVSCWCQISWKPCWFIINMLAKDNVILITIPITWLKLSKFRWIINGLVHSYGNSITTVLELLQSWTKPVTWL